MADRSVRPAIPDDAARIAAVQQAAINADHPDLDPKVPAAQGSQAAVSTQEHDPATLCPGSGRVAGGSGSGSGIRD